MIKSLIKYCEELLLCNVLNVDMYCSGEPCNMSVRGLFQAVRSQLHFSQLSAWWSSSKGTHPINVCYRVTLPGEAFASQFSRPPVHHVFPPAAVGPNTQLKVCTSLHYSFISTFVWRNNVESILGLQVMSFVDIYSEKYDLCSVDAANLAQEQYHQQKQE